MIGRAYVYGLGAGGESGVAKAIEIIRNELDVAMAFDGNCVDRGSRPPSDRGPLRADLIRQASVQALPRSGVIWPIPAKRIVGRT
jgi:hypothetical protein